METIQREPEKIRFFEAVSPLDHRWHPEIRPLVPYVSEDARLRFQAWAEFALFKYFVKIGKVTREGAVEEVEAAYKKITAQRTYWIEDNVTDHDMRALVDALRELINEALRPWIHFGATSYNIINSADAIRRKRLIKEVIIPAMIGLQKELIRIALQEKDTVQVGRTHGQHAVPITFGFALAQFIDRLGECIVRLNKLADELPGSFAGMCGAYNATTLLLRDPLDFEKTVLAEVGVSAARISTQIVPPEPTERLFEEIARASGVLANLADDMRNLQRPEIAEVGEYFGKTQVGSSTSPHKQNPKNWENIKGVWKIIVGRMVTLRLNEISEHQRDLSNSQGMRQDDEIIAYFYMQVRRATKILKKMHIDRERMEDNMRLTGDQILSEAAQLILSDLGYPDAHEKVRVLAKRIRDEEKINKEHALFRMMQGDPELAPYMKKLSSAQEAALYDPCFYIGIAPQKTEAVCRYWMEKLAIEI